MVLPSLLGGMASLGKQGKPKKILMPNINIKLRRLKRNLKKAKDALTTLLFL